MQLKKSNIKRQILKAARKEFNKKGFYQTKIRDIVENSSSSIGNIYVYFENKNDIFHEVVRPTVEELARIISEYETMDHFKEVGRWTLEWHHKFAELAARFIDSNRKNLKLLLFKSQGSRLEGLKEEFIDRATAVNVKLIQRLKATFPDAKILVSEFLMHNYISFLINMASEILMHNISYDQMIEYFNELMIFEHYGFKPLMGDFDFLNQIQQV